MSRVNRLIFSSDYMTLAHAGEKDFIFTIPVVELKGSLAYVAEGTREVSGPIPSGAIMRMRVTYTGTNSTNTEDTDGYIWIRENKGSGKYIDYNAGIRIGNGKVYLDYYIIGNGLTSDTLSTAQTLTIHINYLYQPNT